MQRQDETPKDHLAKLSTVSVREHLAKPETFGNSVRKS